jgi:hypothetical protein
LKLAALLASLVALALASAAAAAAPTVGAYSGTVMSGTPGAKAHSISFKVLDATCAPPLGGAKRQGTCATFSTQSFVPALCAGSGFYYNAFFPVPGPMAFSQAGRIDAAFPLYVSGGDAYATPAAGRTKAGTFQLALVVSGSTATGTERFKVDLGGNDGVCDSGLMKISAHHG